MLEQLIELIDAKIEYAIAQTETGEDGQRSSCTKERKRVEAAVKLIEKKLESVRNLINLKG